MSNRVTLVFRIEPTCPDLCHRARVDRFEIMIWLAIVVCGAMLALAERIILPDWSRWDRKCNSRAHRSTTIRKTTHVRRWSVTLGCHAEVDDRSPKTLVFFPPLQPRRRIPPAGVFLLRPATYRRFRYLRYCARRRRRDA